MPAPDQSPGCDPQGKGGTYLSALFILILFGLARTLYFCLGVEYDVSHLRISWHIIDEELLRNDLLRSIWYLHSQPPLFNFLCGLLLKAIPDSPGTVLQPLYLLLGLVNLLAMSALMQGLGVHSAIRWLILALCAFNPSFILVENWFFYTQPLTCMMTVAAWTWMKYVKSKSSRFAFLAFFILFTMAMIRSLLHLIWYAGLSVLALAFSGRDWKKMISITAIPGAVIFFWYFKNFVLFGTFGVSTWLGMSLAKQTTFQLSDRERRALIADGTFSPMADIRPFSKFSAYYPYLNLRKTGIPILDQFYKSSGSINYNNLAMVEVFRKYLRDAKWTLAHRPFSWARSQKDAWWIYFQTVSLYQFLAANRARIPFMEGLYNSCVYFQFSFSPQFRKGVESYFSFYTLSGSRPLGFTPILLFAVATLWIPYRALMLHRRDGDDVERGTLLFIWFNVIYVAVMGNLLETGDNNRFRFMTEPISWVIFALFLSKTLVAVSFIHPRSLVLKKVDGSE